MRATRTIGSSCRAPCGHGRTHALRAVGPQRSNWALTNVSRFSGSKYTCRVASSNTGVQGPAADAPASGQRPSPDGNGNGGGASLDIAIIGGGIGGLTAARALLDAGHRPTVYERRDEEGMLSGPGGIMMQMNAIRTLELLSTQEGRQPLSTALYSKGGKILNGGFASKSGSMLYANSPEFVGLPDLGVTITRDALQRELHASLPAGTVVNGRSFSAMWHDEDQGKVTVEFDDGSSVTADVVVGADGLRSRVRAALEGREKMEAPEYSGAACWRGTVQLDEVEGGEQWLTSVTDGNSWSEYWGRGSRFGWFKVAHGALCWYAFSNEPAGGKDDSPEASKRLLMDMFKDFAEPVPRLVAAFSTERIYRDDICDRPPLQGQWGKGQVTLLGDAAHPVLPSLGQGGCMAIEDAFELAKALRAACDAAPGGRPSPADVVAALRGYEIDRSPRVAKVFEMSRQVHTMGQTESPLGAAARDLVYRLTPPWLADLQFKWLFSYRPTWETEAAKAPAR